MDSLATGTSPVITVRLPEHLVEAVDALAGSGYGARSRYIRALLERETALALADQDRSTSTQPTRTQEGTH